MIRIYLSSRNNYDMLEPIFLKNNNLEGYQIYNIDDFSTNEEVEKGKQLCAKYNIPFIPNKKRGLQYAAKTFIEYLDENSIPSKFILWLTHDTFVITENFFTKLNDKVKTGILDDFGMVGFNILGPQCGITTHSKVKSKVCGILGRAPLSKLPGRGEWWRTPDMNLTWETYGTPFAIDAPCDMALMINVKLFKKFIDVSDNYHLFCANDDIAMQFLNNNIYNIVLPEFQVFHDQHMKETVHIPVKSAAAARGGDSKHFGDFGKHFDYWFEKWGWHRDNRASFELVADQYEGTIIHKLFYYDNANGPIKYFNV